MTGRDDLKRFTYAERVTHWVAGLSFVFLLFTGLAFSHPRLFWITSLVGGGSTARVLHPWMGVLFTVSMAVMFVMWAKEMGIQDQDRAWLKAIKHYAVHDKDNVPPAGKYNAGQKLFFWSMALLGIAYIVSGIPMWMPGGALGLSRGRPLGAERGAPRRHDPLQARRPRPGLRRARSCQVGPWPPGGPVLASRYHAGRWCSAATVLPGDTGSHSCACLM